VSQGHNCFDQRFFGSLALSAPRTNLGADGQVILRCVRDPTRRDDLEERGFTGTIAANQPQLCAIGMNGTASSKRAGLQRNN